MPNLADHLFRQARERSNKPALFFGGKHYTFSEIADNVRRIAGGLAAAGVTIGTRVGLMMPSRPEFIFYQQAIFALGAIVSPLNIFYRTGELVHAIKSCDLEYLVIGSEFLDRLPDRGTAGTETLKHVILLGDETGVERSAVYASGQTSRWRVDPRGARRDSGLRHRPDAEHERDDR